MQDCAIKIAYPSIFCKLRVFNLEGDFGQDKGVRHNILQPCY
jgi:hypothetical protein